MTTPEEKYVTLRWLKNAGRTVVDFCRRYRAALCCAFIVSLFPTVHLARRMLTTDYSLLYWGPIGRFATLPGYLILEGVLGYSVPLAATHLSYAGHVSRWLTMLVVNFFGWLLIFVVVTAVVRLLLRKRASTAV